MTPAAEVITALGGLGGVAAIVTSAATLIQARRIHAQVSPNHGSSLADAVNRTDAKTAEAAAAVSRLSGWFATCSSRLSSLSLSGRMTWNTRNRPPILSPLTLRHFSVRPDEALVVGDTEYDILMGRNAGVHTCGVTYGNGSRESLEAAGAEWIVC